MPGGNGTGPTGQGPRGGGRRKGASRECVCPKCNQTIPHERGIPCNTLTCPKCGTRMTRA